MHRNARARLLYTASPKRIWIDLRLFILYGRPRCCQATLNRFNLYFDVYNTEIGSVGAYGWPSANLWLQRIDNLVMRRIRARELRVFSRKPEGTQMQGKNFVVNINWIPCM